MSSFLFALRFVFNGKRPFLFLALFFLLSIFPYNMMPQAAAQKTVVTNSRAITVVKPKNRPPQYPEYGVNFISWAKGLTPVSAARYANAHLTGAGWNRWPMYWHDIEPSPGSFNWAYQDVAVENDLRQGFQIDAILLGTPSFYTTSSSSQTPLHSGGVLSVDEIQAATPQGLFEPVFTDGTDIPGAGKQINANNRWARFVATAVNRYKPGGILASQKNLPAGLGITHWEMWNEPDLPGFWDGTTADYARLLKVGYLAANHADPNAQVIFGGLANNSNNIHFYNQVMAIYDADTAAPANDYYHDIFATHNYLYAWHSWYHVFRANNTLRARGLDKPVWLNETGVPVWNDYPGPVCEPGSPYRATMREQADFVVQSAFYARYVGADNIFFFQLYDDCGNAAGNHPYYPPEACTGNPALDPGGDAFGLFRNAADSVCFSHHPQPETPREGLAALQLLTTYFTGVEPLWRRPSSTNNGQEWIAFFQQSTNSRILGMWSKDNVARTAVIAATSRAGTAILIGPDNKPQTVTAVNGQYSVNLPAATNRNAVWDPTLYPIEGRPFILIEEDTLPPQVSITAPAFAAADIPLSWQGSDAGSGIQSYDLQVQIDGQAPFLWLTNTTDTSTTFPPESGRVYRFTVIARDNAHNEQASNTVIVVALDLPEKVYLPIVQR